MNLIPRESVFDLDQFFGDFWDGAPARGAAGVLSPRVDIHEKDGKYLVSAELPGVDRDDVHVTLDNGTLTLSASLEDEHKEEKEGKVIRRERRYGRFARSFYVGTGVTESDIKASFDKGVLKLEIPQKGEAEPERRRIPIN
jgi:HSP20 family protein